MILLWILFIFYNIKAFDYINNNYVWEWSIPERAGLILNGSSEHEAHGLTFWPPQGNCLFLYEQTSYSVTMDWTNFIHNSLFSIWWSHSQKNYTWFFWCISYVKFESWCIQGAGQKRRHYQLPLPQKISGGIDPPPKKKNIPNIFWCCKSFYHGFGSGFRYWIQL